MQSNFPEISGQVPLYRKENHSSQAFKQDLEDTKLESNIKTKSIMCIKDIRMDTNSKGLSQDEGSYKDLIRAQMIFSSIIMVPLLAEQKNEARRAKTKKHLFSKNYVLKRKALTFRYSVGGSSKMVFY